MKAKNLIGHTFGSLIVLDRTEKPLDSPNNNRGAWWNCLCACGNELPLISSALLSDKKINCGCKRKKKPIQGYGEISKSFYTGIKNWSARSRNLEFTVSIEYLWKLFLYQKRKCVYTGKILKFGRSKNDSSRTASLDRIDSTKGYIPGNVVWCFKKINIIKMNSSVANFIDNCVQVSNYRDSCIQILNTIKEDQTCITDIQICGIPCSKKVLESGDCECHNSLKINE